MSENNIDDNLIPEVDVEEETAFVEKERKVDEGEGEEERPIYLQYNDSAFIDLIEKFIVSFNREIVLFDKVTKTSKKEKVHKYAKEIAVFPKKSRVKRNYIMDNNKKVIEEVPHSFLEIVYEDIGYYASVIDNKDGEVLIKLIEQNVDLFIKYAKKAVGRILKELDPRYYKLVADDIDVGIIDYDKMKEVPELSTNDENKLFYFEGDIINMDGSINPLIIERCWECENNHLTLTDIDSKPRKCQYEECRAGIVREVKTRSTKLDTVGFSLQQKNDRAIDGNAQVIECMLIGYEKSQIFLNDISPGSSLALDGILRIEYIQGRKGLETKKFIEVVSFRKQKDSDLFKKDDATAHLVSQKPTNPVEYYEKVVNSVAANIYGRKYHRIKEVVLMVLIGNLAKKDFSGTRYRGDLNLLLVGSPSTAKSEFMNYVKSVDPRAKYGSSLSSKTGFTVGAVLTEDTRRLSYGIIPLANRGTALLDEIDKLNNEAYNAIIECTDDNQTLNYSKAGFYRQIPTKCAHIHACNSNKISGDYNPYLPFYEQVELPAALLSRYDLVFVVQGLDDDEDEGLIKHFEQVDSTLVSENDYSGDNALRNAIDSQKMNVFDKKYMIHLRDYLRSIPASKRPQLKSGSPAWYMLQNFIMKYKKAKHLRFLEDPEADSSPDMIDLRKRRSGRNIAEIIALIMRDSDQVEVHHMQRALELMETSLASLIPKSRDATEDELMNTRSKASRRDVFENLPEYARKQTLENMKVLIEKRKVVVNVIHQLVKQNCPSCKGRGKIIETDGFAGTKAYPCKECKSRGWYYESVSHTDLISYIVDQGRV